MIKYIGKKYLDSNFYSRVSLIEDNEFIKVTAVLDERLKKAETLKLSTPVITEQIENMTEEDKIKEIVLYFLRNNKICEIKQDNDNVVIIGLNCRKLTLKLGSNYQCLIKSIIEKYKIDRIEYVYNNDLDIVVRTHQMSSTLNIMRGISSYNKYIDRIDDREFLVLTLLENDGKIASFDRKFIIDYVTYVINNTSSHIISKRDILGIKIFVDDRCIELPPELSSEVNILVFNRNIEIDEQRRKQFKLEDYYG